MQNAMDILVKIAKRLGRDFIGIEINPEYVKIAENRLNK